MSKKKLLLIGGSGYIGQALSDYFRETYKLYYTSRNERQTVSGHYYLDLNLKVSIEKAITAQPYDIIIILASEVNGLTSNNCNLQETVFQSNLFGLNNLLQAIDKTHISAHLIYVSSMTVYDPKTPPPVKEDSPLLPFHNYGLSKVLAEQVFCFHITTGKNKGVIIRLPGVFGGSKKSGFMHQALLKLSQNQPLLIKTANLKYWESLYIEDLAKMLDAFLKNYSFKASLEILNFSYGQEIDLIKTAYQLKQLLKSTSTIEISERDYQTFYLDNHKLKTIIPFHNYSFDSALKRYIKKEL